MLQSLIDCNKIIKVYSLSDKIKNLKNLLLGKRKQDAAFIKAIS